MSRRQVATARSSQLVSTYGVGSLFPAVDDSVMICGLDHWPAPSPHERVDEVRLARACGVSTFHAPPRGRTKYGDVPVVRFPDYYFCPHCRRLGLRRSFCREDENKCPGPDCGVSIMPSRFVAACSRGHIEDFPYFAWVHRGQEYAEVTDHQMSLRSLGRSSALSDLVVHCSCGVGSRSLAGIFGTAALKGIASCRGRRPWFPEAENEECGEPLRTLQRGSSNVWFPVVRSALSIPPWTEEAARVVARHHPQLVDMEPDQRTEWIRAFASKHVTEQALIAAVRARFGEDETPPSSDLDIREEEYAALVEGKEEAGHGQQFVCRPREYASGHGPKGIISVADVARLREVRALQGFSRLVPWAQGDDDRHLASLAAGGTTWLPAVETLGEGVFLRFDPAAVSAWEATPFATSRVDAIEVSRAAADNGIGSRLDISPRGLLLHTFAHALLDELSLDAGYAAASLRERVYDREDQAGVLIYTASGDSAGSLGGLSAQSEAGRLERVVASMLAKARWCSNDPVCIESGPSGIGGLNIAACHACLLLPETSCERFNLVLDRACLVGTPAELDGGFFPRE